MYKARSQGPDESEVLGCKQGSHDVAHAPTGILLVGSSQDRICGCQEWVEPKSMLSSLSLISPAPWGWKWLGLQTHEGAAALAYHLRL